MTKKMIITIDGPSGVGKSTVARTVSHKLGLSYLDTGAMYRAIALEASRENTDLDNEGEIKSLLDRSELTFRKCQDGSLMILLKGKDVSNELRSEEITRLSSDVATKPIVREKLVALQRLAGKQGGIVAEGRDMGSYVFPEADFKFYLDADLDVRARRRWAELSHSGSSEDLDDIERKIKSRDRQDIGRSESPLHPARNAVIINTTHLKADEVVLKIIKEVQGS